MADHPKLRRPQKSSKGTRKVESTKGQKNVPNISEMMTTLPLEVETTLGRNIFSFLQGEQSSIINEAKSLLCSGVISPTGGGRVQTESPPSLSRSTDMQDEATINPNKSSGQTPNCPSVMGPVLTHHEP